MKNSTNTSYMTVGSTKDNAKIFGKLLGTSATERNFCKVVATIQKLHFVANAY